MDFNVKYKTKMYLEKNLETVRKNGEFLVSYTRQSS